MKKILLLFAALFVMILSANADKISDAFAKIMIVDDVQVQELPTEALSQMGVEKATMVMFFTPASVEAIKKIVEEIPSDVASLSLNDGSKLYYVAADGKKYNMMMYIVGESNIVINMVCPADKFEELKAAGFK